MRTVKSFLCVAAVCVVLCISVAANGRVETVRLQSKLVNKTLPYNVILPPDYHTSRASRYPVLYLLHGLTGHYSDWLTKTNIADYAAEYRIIVVMPEGNDGWYTDSSIVATDKYESYILQELLPDVLLREVLLPDVLVTPLPIEANGSDMPFALETAFKESKALV